MDTITNIRNSLNRISTHYTAIIAAMSVTTSVHCTIAFPATPTEVRAAAQTLINAAAPLPFQIHRSVGYTITMLEISKDTVPYDKIFDLLSTYEVKAVLDCVTLAGLRSDDPQFLDKLAASLGRVVRGAFDLNMTLLNLSDEPVTTNLKLN